MPVHSPRAKVAFAGSSPPRATGCVLSENTGVGPVPCPYCAAYAAHSPQLTHQWLGLAARRMINSSKTRNLKNQLIINRQTDKESTSAHETPLHLLACVAFCCTEAFSNIAAAALRMYSGLSALRAFAARAFASAAFCRCLAASSAPSASAAGAAAL